MKTNTLIIFTRTPLHVGAGSSVGAIDQPVQRERHTGFPIIPGSSVKGVLRDTFTRNPDTSGSVAEFFGRETDSQELTAGKISFGEARLLAFPVRSAKGSFALATSALALRRFARDAGLELEVPDQPDDMSCLAGATTTISRGGQSGVVLEEYRFKKDGDFPSDWEDVLSGLLEDAVLGGAKGRFVLLSDGDLSHFAVSACQVNQHVRIDHETGTAVKGGLFNEETVPTETLFYSPLNLLRGCEEGNAIVDGLKKEQLIQFGGNGTTGLGYCSVKLR